jgi:hypothetical protein
MKNDSTHGQKQEVTFSVCARIWKEATITMPRYARAIAALAATAALANARLYTPEVRAMIVCVCFIGL